MKKMNKNVVIKVNANTTKSLSGVLNQIRNKWIRTAVRDCLIRREMGQEEYDSSVLNTIMEMDGLDVRFETYEPCTHKRFRTRKQLPGTKVIWVRPDVTFGMAIGSIVDLDLYRRLEAACDEQGVDPNAQIVVATLNRITRFYKIPVQFKENTPIDSKKSTPEVKAKKVKTEYPSEYQEAFKIIRGFLGDKVRFQIESKPLNCKCAVKFHDEGVTISQSGELIIGEDLKSSWGGDTQVSWKTMASMIRLMEPLVKPIAEEIEKNLGL